jgi:hypothetical protein
MAVEWNAEAIIQRAGAGVFRAVVAGTEAVRTEAIRLMQETPHTGRVYRRRGVSHQASAPGEPPAVDTGRHIQQITTDYDPANFAGTVTFHSAYALALEVGTAKMAARPYARPALESKRHEIEEEVGKALDEAMRG